MLRSDYTSVEAEVWLCAVANGQARDQAEALLDQCHLQITRAAGGFRATLDGRDLGVFASNAVAEDAIVKALGLTPRVRG